MKTKYSAGQIIHRILFIIIFLIMAMMGFGSTVPVRLMGIKLSGTLLGIIGLALAAISVITLIGGLAATRKLNQSIEYLQRSQKKLAVPVQISVEPEEKFGKPLFNPPLMPSIMLNGVEVGEIAKDRPLVFSTDVPANKITLFDGLGELQDIVDFTVSAASNPRFVVKFATGLSSGFKIEQLE
jgi:hypothetical protein